MMAHEEKQNKWKCPVCSKMFTFKCYLQWHELIHTDEKKYECTDPDCQKKDAGSLNIKLTLSTTWRNILGNILNAKYVGLCGRRRKTNMNMKGVYTDHDH